MTGLWGVFLLARRSGVLQLFFLDVEIRANLCGLAIKDMEIFAFNPNLLKSKLVLFIVCIVLAVINANQHGLVGFGLVWFGLIWFGLV
jgi:hypothetical protein